MSKIQNLPKSQDPRKSSAALVGDRQVPTQPVRLTKADLSHVVGGGALTFGREKLRGTEPTQ